MIGSFFTRGLVMIFGYVYPAYECYKSVELNKPDIEQLRFWCQYWVLVAGLTVFERIGDTFIGWVPMYGEAKLAFFVYLWYPKTKGTTYVYDSFFRPYIAKHETDIDRNLLELKTRAGDMALIYWQKTASYAQTRVFDVLQFIAAQSTPKRSAQPPQKGPKVQMPSAPSRLADATSQPQDEQLSSPASSTSSSEHEEEDAAEVAGPPGDSKAAAPAPAVLKEQKTTPNQALVESSKTLSSSKEQVMRIDSVPPSVNESAAPVQETVMEEAGRLTRARSRKPRAASNR
ncbi:Abscisic acid-responsive family protein [Perilla frutescens var. hirtella]|uniref:HVA22-like protein n=1 Tax=Perilla frutescens var. hirtella TaxID=608512 RepID=A0AAD4NZ77_PERFH|nr:Abscisic acid-responsive family protein [Perilla frutescens var. hirtella]